MAVAHRVRVCEREGAASIESWNSSGRWRVAVVPLPRRPSMTRAASRERWRLFVPPRERCVLLEYSRGDVLRTAASMEHSRQSAQVSLRAQAGPRGDRCATEHTRTVTRVIYFFGSPTRDRACPQAGRYVYLCVRLRISLNESRNSHSHTHAAARCRLQHAIIIAGTSHPETLYSPSPLLP